MAFLLLAWMLPKDPKPDSGTPAFWLNLRAILTYGPALLALGFGIFMSVANEVVNLVFGVWMEDAFSLKIAALGAASAVIGFSELGGETLSVWLTDILDKTVAVALGLALNCFAALALPFLGSSLPGALVGLFLFYLTFEFTIVSSIPLMTEIMPSARATLMAVNVAGLSLGRAVGALLATQFYAWSKVYPSLPDLLVNALVVSAGRIIAQRENQGQTTISGRAGARGGDKCARSVTFPRPLPPDRYRTKFGPMKYATRIKPISYVKANAAELIQEHAQSREPLVITQNGEATAVMQDVASYEATQETLALLKILALGRRQGEDGKVVPAAEAFRRARARIARRG